MTLRALGERLGVSAPYLSAIETGRKSLPLDLARRISAVVEMSSDEAETLLRASDATLDRVSLVHLEPEGRRLVVAFANALPELPSSLVEQLRCFLLPALSV